MAIFLPSFFLVIGVLPFWDALRRRREAQGALMAPTPPSSACCRRALQPGLDQRDHRAPGFRLVLAAFLLLAAWRTPPWLVVALTAVAAGVIG